MTVVSTEGLEAFTDKYLAEQAKRLRPVRPLIEGISGTHQIVDEPTEGLRRLSRAVVRLGQPHSKNIGHPTVPSRAIMHPVRAEFSKELGDVHAGSIGEVLRFGRAARIFRTRFPNTRSSRDSSVLFLYFTTQCPPRHCRTESARSRTAPHCRWPHGATGRTVPRTLARPGASVHVTFAAARSILSTAALSPTVSDRPREPDDPSPKSALSQHQYRHNPHPTVTDRQDRKSTLPALSSKNTVQTPVC